MRILCVIKTLWVLLDFIDRVEYHSPGDFPVKLVFFSAGRMYEVVYVAEGQEALVARLFRISPTCAEIIFLSNF